MYTGANTGKACTHGTDWERFARIKWAGRDCICDEGNHLFFCLYLPFCTYYVMAKKMSWTSIRSRCGCIEAIWGRGLKRSSNGLLKVWMLRLMSIIQMKWYIYTFNDAAQHQILTLYFFASITRITGCMSMHFNWIIHHHPTACHSLYCTSQCLYCDTAYMNFQYKSWHMCNMANLGGVKYVYTRWSTWKSDSVSWVVTQSG